MRWDDYSVLLNHGETVWKLPPMHASDIFLFAKSVEELQRMGGGFDDVFRRRMLKMNANKSKSHVFERDGLSQDNIHLNGEEVIVDKFRYLGLMIRKVN